MDSFIGNLSKADELEIIDEFASPKLEITEIADRISKQSTGGKALLFKNNGTRFPLLINSLGSQKRIEIAFNGRSAVAISKEFLEVFEQMSGPSSGILSNILKLPKLGKLAKIMPKKRKGKGICQEVIMKEPDLSQLPVLHCWPADGGPFITLPLVHTVDPLNGNRNVGMYRMQVLSSKETGMHWHMHKTGARHFQEYKKLGKRMPIAVALGGDPIYTYCATAPLPDGIDEYMLAGFIRKKAVNLVKCISQDLWVPEDADFILEGFVDPSDDFIIEGPFGDHTGFYSLADHYPKFHITAITHRNKAVYPTTIVGIPPQEDAWIGQATEELFLQPLRLTMIPELIDFHLPVPGVAHNIGLFSIHATYPGHGRKALNSVWGAGQMMFTKFGLVFNQTKNLRNFKELAIEISQKVVPKRDILYNTGPLDVLDHASNNMGHGGKMGIDATGEPEILTLPERDELVNHAQQFRSSNPDILSINIELLSQGISIGFIRFKKNENAQARRISTEVLTYETFSQVKFWILSDVNIANPTWFEVAWLVGSNVDPVRDSWIKALPQDEHQGILFIDASQKSANYDDFPRDWPNPVVMDQETIKLVNEKWKSYNIGPAITSPSLRYSPMMLGDSAIAGNQ